MKDQSHPTTSGRSASTETDGQGAKRTFVIPFSTKVLWMYQEVGDAIWLWLWSIERTTVEYCAAGGGRLGIVLRGKPVRDSDIAAEIHASERTVRRWRERLSDLGFILEHRTAYGHRIAVLNSYKFPKREPSGKVPEWTILASQPKPKRNAKRRRKSQRKRERLRDHGQLESRFVATESGHDRIERTALRGRNKEESNILRVTGEGNSEIAPLYSPPGGICASSPKTATTHPLADFEFFNQPQNHTLAEIREAWGSLGMEIPGVQTALHASWEHWWCDHQGEPVPERAAGFLEWIERHGLQAQAGVRFLAALRTKAREVARTLSGGAE